MNKQQAANFNKCLRNGLKVYLKPIGQGSWKKPPDVKICINQNGKEKMGEEVYQQNSEKLVKKINDLIEYLANKI